MDAHMTQNVFHFGLGMPYIENHPRKIFYKKEKFIKIFKIENASLKHQTHITEIFHMLFNFCLHHRKNYIAFPVAVTKNF